jgi:hypothetical protein
MNAYSIPVRGTFQVSYHHLTIVKNRHCQQFGGFFIFPPFVKIRLFSVVFATFVFATFVLSFLATSLWFPLSVRTSFSHLKNAAL